MKTLALVVITCLTVCHVTGELLTVLKRLHSSDALNFLTPEEQVMLVELIAAAEVCRLHAYERGQDRDAILALTAHLPDTEEGLVRAYLENHLRLEERGLCIPNSGSAKPTTQRHR
ncbi:uncharacterized protein [Littorina saxatilis]|uniref:Uncharacterized protein n=1 Tax=Littorina saxatilis TaxID=31220 RepID=A0AAN9BRG5_9CAEN